MLKRLLPALTLVAIFAPVAVPAAQATFPGRPGKILFGEDLSNSACGPGHITTIEPDGSDRTELASGSQGAFSADGRQIAFASCKGNTFSQVSVMNADGSDQREVISRGYSASHPSFSPDGRRLVFVRSEYKGENSDLLTTSVDGSGTRVLTDTPNANETDPSYSPDGRLIVFESQGIRSEGSHIFTIHPNGSHLREVAPGSQPSISPSGRSIAFDRGGSIWQMGIGGRDPRLIKAAGVPGGATEPGPGSQSFRNSDPVFSPDGSRILFVRHRTLPEFGPIPQNFTLWTMRPDGTETKKIPIERGATVIERGADWQAVQR